MQAFATISQVRPAAIFLSRAVGFLCAMLALLSCSLRSSGGSGGNKDILAAAPAEIACSVSYENMSPRRQKAHTITVTNAYQAGEMIFVAFDYSNNPESPEEAAERARIEGFRQQYREELRARAATHNQAVIENIRQQYGLPRGFETANLEETKEIRAIFQEARRASLEELLGESEIPTSDLTLRLVLRNRRGEIIASSPRRTIAEARKHAIVEAGKPGFTYPFRRIALAQAERVELVVSTKQ